jgi:tRNA pseudouridine38-40 synthase
MYNYLIKIEYDGTKFVGWQHQINGISIQEKIEKALKKIFKNKIRINGAGRTDKGVHATGQFANFLIKKKIEDKNKFLNSINFFLRKDLISIIKINKKKLSFHARYQAKERIYEYQIVNRQGSLTIDKNKSWHIKKKN